VQLSSGAWIGNLHCSGPDVYARRDTARAASAVAGWAGSAPALLGGDFNLWAPAAAGFALAGGHAVDHFMVSGWGGAGPVAVLDGGQLSDHKPVVIELDNPS
jgi:endonuclease/exonuclease/phosphatase family metal-dependent hydrolase